VAVAVAAVLTLDFTVLVAQEVQEQLPTLRV
jgi:hypothetical protein